MEPVQSNPSQVNPRPMAPLPPQRLSVSIKGIDMPFLSMMVFMIKWAIASIPAGFILLVILLIVGVIFWGVVSVLCGGLIAGLSNF